MEAQDKVFHLATSRRDLETELIGLIYRQRWEIEVFFKRIKTLLNGGHWFAESPAGAEIQIYCVLVCALLLMLWTGTRPNKRTIEALRFYQMGWATEEELALLLQRAQLAQKKLQVFASGEFHFGTSGGEAFQSLVPPHTPQSLDFPGRTLSPLHPPPKSSSSADHNCRFSTFST